MSLALTSWPGAGLAAAAQQRPARGDVSAPQGLQKQRPRHSELHYTFVLCERSRAARALLGWSLYKGENCSFTAGDGGAPTGAHGGCDVLFRSSVDKKQRTIGCGCNYRECVRNVPAPESTCPRVTEQGAS